MNTFAGIGRIIDVVQKGKVLKFDLASEQGKPCFIPCVVFDTSNEVKIFLERLQTANKVVWLQGRVTSYEYEYNRRIVRKIEIVSYAKSIKPI